MEIKSYVWYKKIGMDLIYSYSLDIIMKIITILILLLYPSFGLISEEISQSKDIAYVEPKPIQSTKIIIKPITIGKNKKVQDVNQVELDQVKSKQMIPLLNYIFFEKDSTVLPLRYSSISKKGTLSFDIQNLFGENTIDIYHHILNIVGERMKKNPQSTLKIIGTKSEVEIGKKSEIIGIERAKTVRDYLASVWGISEDRLKISSIASPYLPSKGTEIESIEENQRVELYSDEDILKPLILNDTLYTPITQKITFYTIVDTNINVYSWELDITDDGDKEVFEDDGDGVPPLTTSFKLNEEIAQKIKNSSRLTYRFELTDENNEHQVVTGSFPITIKTLSQKESQNLLDRSIDKYSLILFSSDNYVLDKKNIEIINYIKSHITNETKLIISGYSDVIGNEEYNMKLSKKRTELVFSQFSDNENKEEYPYGESIKIYNNNNPEGRFYSRTVLIRAVTPIHK